MTGKKYKHSVYNLPVCKITQEQIDDDIYFPGFTFMYLSGMLILLQEESSGEDNGT